MSPKYGPPLTIDSVDAACKQPTLFDGLYEAKRAAPRIQFSFSSSCLAGARQRRSRQPADAATRRAAYRQALKAEALATTRFETPPGRQLQIDFRKRLVEIGGAKVKAFVFVATLGHSRRLRGRAFREHWFAGLESTFTTLSRVPLEVLMDNPRAVVVRHDAVSRSV
ncbi:hypothetical protein GWG67_34545 [Bradyrhizobium sp. CSS354]|nr:hypothetical protein [Bradyrhizobium sp. CSS354]